MYFNSFKKDCFEIMLKFCSRMRHSTQNCKICGRQSLMWIWSTLMETPKLQLFLSRNMAKTFSQEEKFSDCSFSFRNLDRKVYFVVVTRAKIGIGLGSLRKLEKSNISSYIVKLRYDYSLPESNFLDFCSMKTL